MTSLQNFISQLRKTVGADVVVTKAPGYLLNVAAEQVDLNQFERLVAEARSLEPEARGKQLREALGLWRGPPLADFTFEPFAETEIARLEELRSSALEDRIEADLEGGAAAELVGELEGARQAESAPRAAPRPADARALPVGAPGRGARAYQEARRALVDELGIEPSPALQQLHASILRQESALQPQADVPGWARIAVGEVVRALLSGRLVPVLGPGPQPRTGQDLASRLAESFDCPEEHRGDLTRVSQYVASPRASGRCTTNCTSFPRRTRSPGRSSSSWPAYPSSPAPAGSSHQLIVTTGYGHALERAFEERGEEADIVSFIAIGPGSRQVRPPLAGRLGDGGRRAEHVCRALAHRTSGDPQAPRRRRSAARSRATRASSSARTTTSAYLAQSELANVVPVTLAAKLRRSHLLFISYPVVEWSLRVFLHRVFGDQPISYRSWAVLPGAQPIQHEFWRQRGVDLYDVPLDDFVAELERRLSEAAPA